LDELQVSNDENVACMEGRIASQGRDQDRFGRACSVLIVVKIPGGLIEDQAIVSNRSSFSIPLNNHVALPFELPCPEATGSPNPKRHIRAGTPMELVFRHNLTLRPG
jgi:hypothetical protein